MDSYKKLNLNQGNQKRIGVSGLRGVGDYKKQMQQIEKSYKHVGYSFSYYQQSLYIEMLPIYKLKHRDCQGDIEDPTTNSTKKKKN